MAKSYDCVVVGAGFIGVSAAIWMQRAGLSVALVDPNEPGSGASYGNAGCFNGSSVVPISMPGMLKSVPGWLLDPQGPLSIRKAYLPTVMPWLWQFIRAGRHDLVRPRAKALRALLGPTIPYLKELIGPAELDALVRTEGHLYVYRDRSAFVADELGWSLRRENGVVFEELSREKLKAFDPSLSSEYFCGVRVAENGHTIDPGQLVGKLAEHFAASGGTLVKGRAQRLRIEGGRLTGVETEGAFLASSSAVIAAGARSSDFTRQLGDKIPLESERGYHAVIDQPEVVPRIPTTDTTGKFIATPMREGLRLAGTVELGGLDASPNWKRARRLVTHAQRMFPGLPRTMGESRLRLWMGHRPSLPDSLPVIGRAAACRDIIYAFGHGHVGMTGAPMTGRLVGQLVRGQAPEIDLSPFRPDRF